MNVRRLEPIDVASHGFGEHSLASHNRAHRRRGAASALWDAGVAAREPEDIHLGCPLDRRSGAGVGGDELRCAGFRS